MQGTEFVMVPVSWLEELEAKMDQLLEERRAPEGQEFMRADEAQEYTGIPKATLYKLVREHRLNARRVGRTVLFTKEALDNIGMGDQAV